jgi:hypothetical protein
MPNKEANQLKSTRLAYEFFSEKFPKTKVSKDKIIGYYVKS